MDQTATTPKKRIETTLIQQSSFVFHSYSERNLDAFTSILDPDFIWIGSYAFQYTKGIDDFVAITKQKLQDIPVQISNENYHILSHDHSLWVVYGTFTASTWTDDSTYISTQQRATFVWRYTKDGFRLLHLHCTMSRDIPLEEIHKIREKKALDVHWYEYMQTASSKENVQKQRIMLRDLDGKIHYLFPSEFLYVEMNYRIATIHTTNQQFDIRKTVQQLTEELPFLLQTHKSWLVNPMYITTFRRYQVSLSNGTEIPIGKPRYDEVKEKLRG